MQLFMTCFFFAPDIWYFCFICWHEFYIGYQYWGWGCFPLCDDDDGPQGFVPLICVWWLPLFLFSSERLTLQMKWPLDNLEFLWISSGVSVGKLLLYRYLCFKVFKACGHCYFAAFFLGTFLKGLIGTNLVEVPAHPHRCFHLFRLIRPAAQIEGRWTCSHSPKKRSSN